MAKGGASYSGRALRFVLWDLPLRVTRYSIARNTAAATEEGQRLLALVGFGAWVAVFWYLAWLLRDWFGMVVPLQVAGLFGLLLVWRIVGHGRRLWKHRHNLTNMAVSIKRQREIHQVITQLPEQMYQSLLAAYQAGGEMRDYGPAYAQTRQMERDQAEAVREQVRSASGDEVPTGEWRPMTPMPKWLKRRLGRKGRDE
jgi:hypothetical protein